MRVYGKRSPFWVTFPTDYGCFSIKLLCTIWVTSSCFSACATTAFESSSFQSPLAFPHMLFLYLFFFLESLVCAAAENISQKETRVCRIKERQRGEEKTNLVLAVLLFPYSSPWTLCIKPSHYTWMSLSHGHSGFLYCILKTAKFITGSG